MEYKTEETLQNGARPGAYKIVENNGFWRGFIKEIKPHNLRSIQRAVPQLARYVDQLIKENLHVGEWVQTIETYSVVGVAGYPEVAPVHRRSIGVFYTVRAGDNLFSIAKLFRVDAEDVAKGNGISDPDRIRSGDKISIKRFVEPVTIDSQ